MDLAGKTCAALAEMEDLSRSSSRVHALDARAKTFVLLAYIAALTSMRVTDLTGTAGMALYPCAMALWSGAGLGWTWRRSLIVLPLIVGIGLFNPWYDTSPGLIAGRAIGISNGWISLFVIVLRGLLAAQASLLLIASTGFDRLCAAWAAWGLPRVFVNQLSMMYRYLFVLAGEALSLQRAFAARSGGKKPGLAVWASMTGGLLARSMRRGQRIDRAMKSRGYSGELPRESLSRWTAADAAFVVAWCSVFLILRYLHPVDAWLNLVWRWME